MEEDPWGQVTAYPLTCTARAEMESDVLVVALA